MSEACRLCLACWRYVRRRTHLQELLGWFSDGTHQFSFTPSALSPAHLEHLNAKLNPQFLLVGMLETGMMLSVTICR